MPWPQTIRPSPCPATRYNGSPQQAGGPAQESVPEFGGYRNGGNRRASCPLALSRRHCVARKRAGGDGRAPRPRLRRGKDFGTDTKSRIPPLRRRPVEGCGCVLLSFEDFTQGVSAAARPAQAQSFSCAPLADRMYMGGIFRLAALGVVAPLMAAFGAVKTCGRDARAPRKSAPSARQRPGMPPPRRRGYIRFAN